MKLGAACFLFALLSLALTVGVLGGALYLQNPKIALVALGLLVFTLGLFLVYRIFANSAHCPLCRSPVIGGSGAQRSRYARSLFGSHRLRVCCGIVARNSFICPYCNEATRCTVKQRPNRNWEREKP